MKKILVVNAHAYTFKHLWYNTYESPLYNIATYYKREGHDVTVFDMKPESIGKVDLLSNKKNEQDETRFFKGIPLTSNTKRTMACGNYEAEGYEKYVFRYGFPIKELQKALKGKKYDEIIVGGIYSQTNITSFVSYYSQRGCFEVIDLCKQLQPKAKVIYTGAFVQLDSAYALLSNADEVLTEGHPAENLLDTDLSLMEDLPDKVNILSSIGCNNGCKFCCVHALEGDTQKRNVSDVLNYIDHVVNTYGITKFRFMDTSLLSEWDSHMKLILEGVIAKGLDLTFVSGGIESKLFSEDKAILMKQAGFKTLRVPLDNADPTILAEWGNKTLDEWKNAVTIAKEHFDRVVVNTIIGYPNQTYQNVQDMIALCAEYEVEISFIAFAPFNKTGFQDNTLSSKFTHPFLWAYAWEGLTVEQLEDVFDNVNLYYTKSVLKAGNKPLKRNSFVSSSPIKRPK